MREGGESIRRRKADVLTRPGDDFPRHTQMKIALWMTRTPPGADDVGVSLGLANGTLNGTVLPLKKDSDVDTE